MHSVTVTRPAPSGKRLKWPTIDSPSKDEHDLYPVHEEDNVPEKPLHRQQVRYLEGALAAHLPGKWVTGDICMYWEERNFQQYAAPDVLVVDGSPPDAAPDVHLKWADPPALFVIEVGSKSTFLRDEGPKLDTYGLDLQVPEYLYYHPTRHQLHLYRLGSDRKGYEPVARDKRDWAYSETLNLYFGEDDTGVLRIYTPDGERLLSHEEETIARQEAETRAADAERRLADLQAELEKLRRGTT